MKFPKYIWPTSGILIVIAVSFFGSIWQGQYTVDHLHWGLMLGNAKDLANGLVPYKEIYILYGFLTTLIHSIAYLLLGKNLQSLIIVTAAAYVFGMLLIYPLTNKLVIDRRLATYALVTCFLFHPIAIYPWSNYVAFPFLVLALIFNIRTNSWRNCFISGLLFGSAVLAREGLAPAVIAYVFASAVVDWLTAAVSRRKVLSDLMVTLLGVGVPICTFLLYLEMHQALPFWRDIAWYLPKLYAREFFPHMTGIKLLTPLMGQILHGFTHFDFRWILVAFIILSNIAIILFGLFNKKYRIQLERHIKLAIFSLLLLSSSLHLAEIFRISTGSLVGIINVYYLLKLVGIHKISFIVITVILIVGMFPSGSGDSFSTTNYFFPSKEIINRSQLVSAPPYFKEQRWEPMTQQYYQNVSSDLAKIATVCHIKYHYNQTYDAFLQILSPFEKLQLAPFYLSNEMEALRPDLDWKRRLQESDNLIIFKHVPTEQDNVDAVQKGFFVFKKYVTPRTNFIYAKNSLLILVPNRCQEALQKD